MPLQAVRTSSCSLHGHPEFVLKFQPEVVPEPDVRWLVDFLEGEVADGTTYRPGETLRVGWTELQIDTAGDDLLLLEPDWTGCLPIAYVPSVTRALADLRQQRDVVDSVGLSEELALPVIWQSGLICDAWDGKTGGVLDREKGTEQDSGWFFGCADPNHDHNDAHRLKRLALYEIACRGPQVIPFCGLPAGVKVELNTRRSLAIYRDGRQLAIRPGSFLAALINPRKG